MQQPCLKSELSLFDPPMAQVSMERSAWVDIHPIASLEGASPIEFHVAGTQDDYLDLNDTALYIKMKIVKSDGGNLDAASKAHTANLILSTLFADATLTLNETVIEGGHYLYPYKAMMASLLQFNGGVKLTQMEASGYLEKAEDRIKWFAGSKSMEFMGPLHLDLLCQSKYLLSGVDVRIKLTRSKMNFAIINEGKKGTVKIKIEEAILYVRKVRVAPAVIAGHELGLNTQNAIYPIQQSELQSYTIAQGNTSHTQDNLFRGQIPKLVLIGLVGNSAFSGDMNQDPMLFKHFDMNYIALYRDGESVPYTQPLQPDFANNLYIRSYMSMIQGLELFNINQDNDISISEYKDGKSLFVFNLTPDLSASGACGQPYKTGNLRLELKFAKALTEAINVIVFAIRDGKIEINKERQVIKCQ